MQDQVPGTDELAGSGVLRSQFPGIATARALQKELKHLEVKVTDHRPKSHAPSAKEIEDGFEVSFVAFEMDRMLQLVHVVARVKRDGTASLKRHPIVSGPMTSWQTAMLRMEEEDQQELAAAMEVEAEMRAEVERSAAAAFQRLRVRRTAGGTGVLLYVSLYERMVHVLGDHAVAEKLEQSDWNDVCGLVVDGLKQGRGAEGLIAAVRRCGDLLAAHFPAERGDRNEITDELRFLD